LTLTTEIDKLLDDYRGWLKNKTSLNEIDGAWIEITTPYLDRHNDALQIYAMKQNNGFLLTDDSYTINDLESSGCNLNTGKRKELLRMTLAGFGIKLNEDALEVHASANSFPLKKHNLIQAMLAVNDLFYTSRQVVESLFFEDVVTWLDYHDIRYTPKPTFHGASGYDHSFDFVIPKSRKEPERIIQTINRPNRDTAEALIHKWTDTREERSPESRAYAILNDMGQTIPNGVLEALSTYLIRPVRWSEREMTSSELAA
jgi:hypothetical protein